MPFERRFLTIAEAAVYLGVHSQTIYQWLSLDLLPCVRLGKHKRTIRIDGRELDRRLQAQLEASKKKSA